MCRVEEVPAHLGFRTLTDPRPVKWDRIVKYDTFVPKCSPAHRELKSVKLTGSIRVKTPVFHRV